MLKLGIGAATAALAAAFTGGAASAQTTYVALGAGWTRIDSADTRIDHAVSPGVPVVMSIDLDDDFNGRGAVGWDLGDLRVEGEFGITAGDANSYRTTQPGAVTRQTDGTVNLVSGMVNAYWDFGSQGLTPFVGIGAGAVKGEFEIAGPPPTSPNAADVTIINNDATNFAWQAMAGLALPLGGNMTGTAQFRYFNAGTFGTTDANGRATNIDIKGSSWDIGLRWGF